MTDSTTPSSYGVLKFMVVAYTLVGGAVATLTFVGCMLYSALFRGAAFAMHPDGILAFKIAGITGLICPAVYLVIFTLYIGVLRIVYPKPAAGARAKASR